jgi:D-inositol-3-phosphate glycosyltransferase
MKRYIGMISEHASPLAMLGGVDSGGQNVYVGELARQLGELGNCVDVFTRWDDPALPQVVAFAKNVRVVHIKAGPVAPVRKEELLQYMGEMTQGILRFTHTRRYDLFHANFWMSALVAADLRRRTGIPFAVTFHALGKVRLIHQGKADQFPAERLEIEARVCQEADAIIAECPQDEEDLIVHYNAPAEKITIIPCGVNTRQFHPVDKRSARQQLGLNPDERIILQLGRMVPRKGVQTVIEALALLVHHYEMPARLLIVGGESDDPDPVKTPEIGRLTEIAERLDARPYVTFTGRRRRDVLKVYFAASDVFVTTPWYEPFGMTPLEAMACGTPVIGANVGGIKFSVADGETGFLVPPKDPEALAEKLYRLLSDESLAAQFSRNATARVQEHFVWHKVGRQVASLFENILINEPILKGVIESTTPR